MSRFKAFTEEQKQFLDTVWSDRDFMLGLPEREERVINKIKQGVLLKYGPNVRGRLLSVREKWINYKNNQ